DHRVHHECTQAPYETGIRHIIHVRAIGAALPVIARGWYNWRLGPWSGGVTPVPIPNTAVKPTSAEDTWDVGPWENRSGPGSKTTSTRKRWGRFVLRRTRCGRRRLPTAVKGLARSGTSARTRASCASSHIGHRP